MSLAAVPAYFLARRVLAQPLALVAAALAVAVPSLIYTGTLMTENAFYPLFLCAALALVLVARAADALRTASSLGVCLVAFLTRAQAVALLPALLTAPLCSSAGRARVPRASRCSTDSAAAGFVGVLVVQLARGRSPLGVLGAYEVTGRADYSVGRGGEVVRSTTSPSSTSSSASSRSRRCSCSRSCARRLDRRDRIFLAAALPVLLARARGRRVRVAADVAAIEERNMFYVAPLFLIALLVWIERGAAAAAAGAAIAAVLAAGCRCAVPYDDFIGVTRCRTRSRCCRWWLVRAGLALDRTRWLVVLVARRRRRPRVPVRSPRATRSCCRRSCSSTSPCRSTRSSTSIAIRVGAAPLPADHDRATRLDRPRGRARRATSRIWTGSSNEFTIWENEFFNRSVGAVYRRAGRSRAGWRRRRSRSTQRTGYVRRPDGSRVPASLRAHRRDRWSSAARVVGEDGKGSCSIASTARCARSRSSTGSIRRTRGRGKRVTYTRLGCAAAR